MIILKLAGEFKVERNKQPYDLEVIIPKNFPLQSPYYRFRFQDSRVKLVNSKFFTDRAGYNYIGIRNREDEVDFVLLDDITNTIKKIENLKTEITDRPQLPAPSLWESSMERKRKSFIISLLQFFYKFIPELSASHIFSISFIINERESFIYLVLFLSGLSSLNQNSFRIWVLM